jgi:iron complex outermembrane recepter protein
MQKFLLLIFSLVISYGSYAQKATIKGTVVGSDGLGVIGAGVTASPGNASTITDVDGNYMLTVDAGTYTVTATSIGMADYSTSVTVGRGETKLLAFVLEDDNVTLQDVVLVGTRTVPRTNTSSPLPVDILSAKDLRATGQTSFDKALQYRVPSFNTANTPVNDATTLLDPYEIRNMGPSRTLILINGKRKNLSSLLYVQFSPGRGETGVDLSSIPQEAIERVEILRDGASAQYGSDAIAGVMNIILKSKYDYSTLNLNAGMTSKGDGKTYGVSYNGGHQSTKSFINYTFGVNQQGNAVRSGTIHVPTEIATFGNPYGAFTDSPNVSALEKFQKETGIRYDGSKINPNGANATQAEMEAWNGAVKANNDSYNGIITDYLKDYPTGNNINGTAEVSALKLLLNGGVNYSEKGQLYANGAIVTKRALSNANYRTPYWRQDRGLLHSPTDNGGKNYIKSPSQLAFGEDGIDLYKGYVGYMPSFEGDLNDYHGTIGVKDNVNGWNTDVSITTGGNTQLYTVNNTVNRSLGKSSPTRFKPGGFKFNHIVGNLDISKSLTDKLAFGIGAEARSETYEIIAGDEASFFEQGSNSFPGINSVNAAKNSRSNIGAYADLSYDFNENFLINLTGRGEKYSDFGNASVFKASTRYKLADDKFVIRGSYSTGFRAPTLQQLYSQSIQASFAGGTIVTSGLYNNSSAQARLLGIPTLKAEKSKNISLGIGVKLPASLSLTVDYYNITVKDRIVYSSSISTKDESTDLYKILAANDLASVQFFINGIETNTSGIDLVLSKRDVDLGPGALGISLAGNFVLNNEIVGAPNEPGPIKSAGSSILNEQIKSLLTESRPNYKAILGLDYQVKKFNVNINNTLFGSTAFRDLDNGGSIMNDIKAVFKPAVVTDLSVGYSFNDKIALTLNANNILNVIPKWDLEASAAESVVDKAASKVKADAVLNDPAEKALLRGFLGFSGRYDILGYNGSQFSQLGTILNANLSVKF